MSLIPRNYFGDFLDDFIPVTKEENMKCDIYEKDNNYYIEMDAPGFNKNEIQIEVKDNNLIITAEKTNEVNEEDTKNYIHRERSYGKVQRSFYLRDLDANKIEASFENGVLNIIVPKKDDNEDKKFIEIR